MKVLFLGAPDSPLVSFLGEAGEEVTVWSEPIDPAFLRERGIEFIVSYGYRHILRKEVLDLLPLRAVNLHIALLPWNRGADPNLWSFIEGTPRGVTIHHIDAGVDTGPILAQERIEFAPGETLATSYQKLRLAIEDLFRRSWARIRTGTDPGRAQQGAGSVHRTKDRRAVEAWLTRGWDTPVEVLEAYGRERER